MDDLDKGAAERLFLEARTYNSWQDRSIDDAVLRRLYALLRMGPTAANTNPGRFVFIRSATAKARLKPCLAPGNVDKTMSAPACVIVASDTRFFEFMPQLFPARDMSGMFADNQPLVDETAQRNSTLQGAYLIMAARALGLDAGPMSGFNAEVLDVEFFPDGRWKSNFLCNLGCGSEEGLHPRNPRLEFYQACRDL